MWGIVGKVFKTAFQRHITYGPCDRFMTCRDVIKVSQVFHHVRCRWKGIVKSFKRCMKYAPKSSNVCKTFIKCLRNFNESFTKRSGNMTKRWQIVKKRFGNVHQTIWQRWLCDTLRYVMLWLDTLRYVMIVKYCDFKCNWWWSQCASSWVYVTSVRDPEARTTDVHCIPRKRSRIS
jgi:hypothetical protein